MELRFDFSPRTRVQEPISSQGTVPFVDFILFHLQDHAGSFHFTECSQTCPVQTAKQRFQDQFSQGGSQNGFNQIRLSFGCFDTAEPIAI